MCVDLVWFLVLVGDDLLSQVFTSFTLSLSISIYFVNPRLLSYPPPNRLAVFSFSYSDLSNRGKNSCFHRNSILDFFIFLVDLASLLLIFDSILFLLLCNYLLLSGNFGFLGLSLIIRSESFLFREFRIICFFF